MINPFIGTYWSQRKESRSECAARLVKILDAISFEPAFRTWYAKAKTRGESKALQIENTAPTIESLLRTNNRDTDGKPISELGFSLSAWNGDSTFPVTLGVTCGAYSKFVTNSAVLQFSACNITPELCVRLESLLAVFVSVFEPENAIVSSLEELNRVPNKLPWEAEAIVRFRADTQE